MTRCSSRQSKFAAAALCAALTISTLAPGAAQAQSMTALSTMTNAFTGPGVLLAQSVDATMEATTWLAHQVASGPKAAYRFVGGTYRSFTSAGQSIKAAMDTLSAVLQIGRNALTFVPATGSRAVNFRDGYSW